MKVLLFILPLTALSIIVACIGFIWAVRSNQFDDLDSPAYRILYDEDIVPLDKEEKKKKEENIDNDSNKKKSEDGNSHKEQIVDEDR